MTTTRGVDINIWTIEKVAECSGIDDYRLPCDVPLLKACNLCGVSKWREAVSLHVLCDSTSTIGEWYQP